MNHPVIITFLLFAIIGFMYFAAEVLQPLALAILFSLVLSPITKFLQHRGVPRTPAVFLTVFLVLGTLGGIGYIVGQQLTSLGNELSSKRDILKAKIERTFQPEAESAVQQFSETMEEVVRGVQPDEDEEQAAASPGGIQRVEVVDRPSFQERLQRAVGPLLQPTAIFGLVLVLVLFIMMNREEMLDRIIKTFGLSSISSTTRTLEEAAQRISRYLAIFTAYNSTCGFILGLGLYFIGVPYAVLWGFLAAVLRFIPYVGPWSAFGMPLLYSIAAFDTWREPIMVIILFLSLESVSNGYLEPIIYGRTAGISTVGLLVAAMFWTWVWGPLGLLLSTPLTVCLAVLGKYVPSLRIFSVMLGDDEGLDPDVRFYQRGLASDHDSAVEIVEEALASRPRHEVFDHILIPALSRAERDHARGGINDDEREFLWNLVRDLLDDLEANLELGPLGATDGKEIEAESKEKAARTRPIATTAVGKVLGVPTEDTSDVLALRMLKQLLAPSGVELEILDDNNSPMQVAAEVAEESPNLVLISHLPPVGLTVARYLARRLNASYPDQPLWVGRWGESGDLERVTERLKKMGAKRVVFSLEEAQQRIVESFQAQPEAEPSLEALANSAL